MSTILPVPPTLKPCQTYIKLAATHDSINPTIAYWARLYALQTGMKIDAKEKENLEFLMSIMEWLEKEKKLRSTDEKITNEVVAQAHVENYGMKIFLKADEDDRAGKATKNTAKQFFTAAQIFDLLAVFGNHEVTEEFQQKSMYAKWRAACRIKTIKNGEQPQPPEEKKSNDETNEFGGDLNNQPSSDTKPHIDIGPPPPAFGNNDFNVDQINDLTIENKKPPSSATSTATNYSNKTISDYSSTPVDDHSCATDVDSPVAINGAKLSKEDILKAQKYSKWASSSLDYDDIKTLVMNLQKALSILVSGKED